MASFRGIFVVLLFNWLSILSNAAFYSKTSGVINADASNFDKLVAANEDEVVMVEFYAPWCGHCKQLQPEYVKLAKSLKNVVKVVAIDASEDKNRGIASRYGVQGFPTLKAHVGTGPAIDYNQARDAKSMKQFLLSKLPSYVTRLTNDKLPAWLEKNAAQPRALVLSKQGTVSPTVKRFSALMNGHMAFGSPKKSEVKAMAKKHDSSTKDGSVVIVYPAGQTEEYKVFSGNTKSFKEAKLKDHSCYVENCEKKGLCVILIKGEDDDDYNKVHTILKEIEETADDASLFAFSQITASEGENFQWLTSIFGSLDTYYSNIMVLAPQKKRYAHYVGSVSSPAIKGFISGILTGKTRTAAVAGSEIPSLSTETEYCKPPPKPKKKPSKQSGGGGSARSSTPKSGPGGGSDFIVTITNDNWQEIIYGNNQPLVVEFYAPWCGHCKQLAPEFAKAATHLKGMVIFGAVNCDEDANKPLCGQFQVQGFPTIKVFPYGKDRKQRNGPKDFQGQRNAAALERAATDALLAVKVPAIKESGDLENFLNDEASLVRVLLFSSKKKAPTLLRALASAFDMVSFGLVTEGSAVAEELKVEAFPSIIGYVQGSSEGVVYEGQKTFIDLTQWVVSLAQKSQGQAGESGESINHEEL